MWHSSQTASWASDWTKDSTATLCHTMCTTSYTYIVIPGQCVICTAWSSHYLCLNHSFHLFLWLRIQLMYILVCVFSVWICYGIHHVCPVYKNGSILPNSYSTCCYRNLTFITTMGVSDAIPECLVTDGCFFQTPSSMCNELGMK